MPTKLYNKEQILDTCRGVFAQYQYDAASTQALADASKVSKALLFHHFGSKKELFFSILERALTIYHREVDLAEIEKDDFFEALTAYMGMKLNYCRYHTLDYVFLRSAFYPGPPALKKEMNETFGSIALADIKTLQRLFGQVKLRFAINKDEAFDLIIHSADGFEQRFVAALTGEEAADSGHLETAIKRIANYMNMIRYGIE